MFSPLLFINRFIYFLEFWTVLGGLNLSFLDPPDGFFLTFIFFSASPAYKAPSKSIVEKQYRIARNGANGSLRQCFTSLSNDPGLSLRNFPA